MGCVTNVIECLQMHSALITAIATIVLAVATIVLVLITRLYLKETKQIRLDSNRPYLNIIPFTESDDFILNSYLVITNEGKGSAFNVKGTMKYPLLKTDDSTPHEYKEEALDISYRPVAVGQGVKVPLEMWKGNNIPSSTEPDKARFTVTLNYGGSYEKNLLVTKSFSVRDFNRKWDEREKSNLFNRYQMN